MKGPVMRLGTFKLPENIKNLVVTKCFNFKSYFLKYANYYDFEH